MALKGLIQRSPAPERAPITGRPSQALPTMLLIPIEFPKRGGHCRGKRTHGRLNVLSEFGERRRPYMTGIAGNDGPAEPGPRQ
jgi:hypothetical protein